MSYEEIEIYEIGEGGRVTTTRTIKRSSIAACPFLIMVPEHYREDGTCKCNCAVERARMVEEWDYTAEDFKAAGIEL
jgi:hypothetical protein